MRKHVDFDSKSPVTDWANTILSGVTILGIAVGAYVILNQDPNTIKKERESREIQNIITIPDMNNDKFPELQVTYKSGTIDTLYSRFVEFGVNYRKSGD